LFKIIPGYLDLIVQAIQLFEFVYLDVDGPAPFTKCAQQQSYRFLSRHDRKSESFNILQISVGTSFMENLNQQMIQFGQGSKYVTHLI
jgi:5'-3' exonuclease